jgi:anaerobic sulfite reductase subunit B
MATVAEAAPMTPRPFRVARRRRETADTWTLELEPVQGAPLEARPGQFTMLYAFGIGEVPISVSRTDGSRLVHTVRAVGAVTGAICDARPGTMLGVRGPFGNAWPVEHASGGDLVLVAGGIGLAPLRPALLHVLEHRADYRAAVLLYGSRTPRDLLYRTELERLGRRSDLDLRVTVDAAAADWRGKVGVVAKLVAEAPFEGASTTALLCGPEIMMRFTAQALIERGVAPARIFASMERNMTCGLGYCGHCQLGPTLICRDGPVYAWDELEPLLAVREL